jgi:hypothetical protein
MGLTNNGHGRNSSMADNKSETTNSAIMAQQLINRGSTLKRPQEVKMVENFIKNQ